MLMQTFSVIYILYLFKILKTKTVSHLKNYTIVIIATTLTLQEGKCTWPNSNILPSLPVRLVMNTLRTLKNIRMLLQISYARFRKSGVKILRTGMLPDDTICANISFKSFRI